MKIPSIREELTITQERMKETTKQKKKKKKREERA